MLGEQRGAEEGGLSVQEKAEDGTKGDGSWGSGETAQSHRLEPQCLQEMSPTRKRTTAQPVCSPLWEEMTGGTCFPFSFSWAFPLPKAAVSVF